MGVARPVSGLRRGSMPTGRSWPAQVLLSSRYRSSRPRGAGNISPPKPATGDEVRGRPTFETEQLFWPPLVAFRLSRGPVEGKNAPERGTSMPGTVPELIDIETLAQTLGDSVRHVRRMVAERRIPYLKVGHFVRFDPEEITAWLDARRVEVAVDVDRAEQLRRARARRRGSP